MIYRLEKATAEGMKITKKGESAPLKFYSGAVSARLAIASHKTIKGGFDTGLDEAKQKYFEEKIELEPGTLGVRSDYWADFGIYVKADGTVLDDENPEHELQLFQLKRRKDVAFSKLEVRTKNAKWLVTSEESEAEVETARRDYLINALRVFADMSPADMRSYLEAQKVDTSTMSDTVVKKKVGDEAEKKPKSFLLIANDSRKADKVFIYDLVKHGIIRQSANKYVNEENVPLAYSDDDMLVFLADNNNSTTIALWKKQLKAAKKGK